jgi:hypothetical protein
MKTLIIALAVLLQATSAHAYWYLVDKNGNVIDRQDAPYEHVTGLESRGERQIEESTDIPLEEARFAGNKIKKQVKTNEEIKAERDAGTKRMEEALIQRRIRKTAIDSLKAEGIVFEQTLD